jgi:GAF domain-containing protein
MQDPEQIPVQRLEVSHTERQQQAVLTAPEAGCMGVEQTLAVRLEQLEAAQASIAIENARLYEETERRRREAEVIAELARDINASLDLATILQRVVERAKELCASDLASIALCDSGSEAVVVRYRVGNRAQRLNAYPIEVGKGIGGQVLLTGCPFRTAGYADDPRISKDYREQVDGEGVVAVVAVPIRIGERVEGVLYAVNRSPRPFTDRDEAILVQLAAQAAVAVENARLFALELQRRQHLQTVLELNREITGELHLERLLSLLIQKATMLLKGYGGVLFRYDETSQLLMPHATSNVVIRGSTPFTLGQGAAGMAAAQRRGLIINDYQASPASSPLAVQQGIAAVIAQPLLSAGKLLGVIRLTRLRDAGPFTEGDLELLETFAGQATVALENARLYEQERHARDAAEGQAQQLAILMAVSTALSAQRTLADILQTVGPEVLKHTRFEQLAITFLEEDG